MEASFCGARRNGTALGTLRRDASPQPIHGLDTGGHATCALGRRWWRPRGASATPHASLHEERRNGNIDGISHAIGWLALIESVQDSGCGARVLLDLDLVAVRHVEFSGHGAKQTHEGLENLPQTAFQALAQIHHLLAEIPARWED